MRRAVVWGAAVLLAVITAVVPASGTTPIEVAPRAMLSVQLDGFASRATVTLWLVGEPGTTTQRADRRGVLRTRYRAPSVPGWYRLAVTGAPRATDRPPDALAIVVTVPQHAVIPINVVPPGQG